MGKKTEADNFVDAVSQHVESTEIMKRNLEKSAEQNQRDREEAIASLSEMAGKLKATNFFKTQADFFNLLLLKQVKDSKEYRDRLGMTWEAFCESIGLKRRTVDEQLQDLQPFRLEFLAAFRQLSGSDMSKIKYLGMAVTGGSAEITENAITYNGETIPIDAEHKDEIQALLETLEENHKKEKEEAEITIKTKDRLLKAKEDTINRMERELKRLEKTVPKSELTEEEQDAVNLLARVQTDFLAALSDIKKKIKPHESPEIALRQYYYLLIFMSKITMEERLELHEEYANAEEVPWEITEMELPPTDVLIDNLPLTAGRGIGGKVKAKIEERQNRKSGKE